MGYPQCATETEACAYINGDGCSKLVGVPKDQWTRVGGCAHRTHNRSAHTKETGKPAFIDPLKASKQAMKARIKEAKKASLQPKPKKKERTDSR